MKTWEFDIDKNAFVGDERTSKLVRSLVAELVLAQNFIPVDRWPEYQERRKELEVDSD